VLVIGAREPKVIAAVVRGIRGPLNIAVRAGYPSVRELEALGVKRVSVTAAGAVRAFLRDIAVELLDCGTYTEITSRSAVAELNASFRRRPTDTPGPRQEPTGGE
jgi:2-methylisocitrate lyase-like PEP mutase family enzyme